VPKRLLIVAVMLIVAGGTGTAWATSKPKKPKPCRFEVGLSPQEAACLADYLAAVDRYERRLEEWKRSLAPPDPRTGTTAGSGSIAVPGPIADIIYAVFGAYGAQAVSVAMCESGLSVTATNGQFFGLFQMGSSERATYGGSSLDPWEQARAAHAYFVASGSDWSPWSCRP
jgi:hypothetical protein